MRFLVDAQLPPALCRWMEARGHRAVHVTEVLPGAVPDTQIAAYAESEQMILVSKDEDFVLLRLPDRFGLVWLRCGNTSNRALRDWMDPRWRAIERLLAAGERMVEAR